MSQPTQPADPISQEMRDAGIKFAMQAFEQVPKADMLAFEAHVTGMLIVFWGALWGTFGTEYARDFIEAQLRGMEPDVPKTIFTPPKSH